MDTGNLLSMTILETPLGDVSGQINLTQSPGQKQDNHEPTFIDLFAGCGGLSLGLSEASWNNTMWHGAFAIEKDRYAFETFKSNLIDRNLLGNEVFSWPSWLPQKETNILELLRTKKSELERLEGKIDLIAGGPPCQGFSLVGRRSVSDPRNKLFRAYMKVVNLVKPKILLIENVLGINYAYNGEGKKPVKFGDKLRTAVIKEGYEPFERVVYASELGVPQSRPRFFLIGVRKDLLLDGRRRGRVPKDIKRSRNPWNRFDDRRREFLLEKGLDPDTPTTVGEALSDFETSANSEKSDDSPGFMQLKYTEPRTQYQRLMHPESFTGVPNSRRLANHRPDISSRFERLQNKSSGNRGERISRALLEKEKLKKHTIWYLDQNSPAPTITTLPDDMLHYRDPRIPTVRELARLQSFPDWFEFHGKYTTGGTMRTQECPRFTQVGNAVAPLVAEGLGRMLLEYVSTLAD
jgi:DNA (cytosine-5)-methyltransferase 1